MEVKDVDCRTIEKAVHRHFRGKGHEWIIPTIDFPGWWECDIFTLTKAGYFIEVEIKVLKSDFKADFKKALKGWNAERFRGYPPMTYRANATEEERERQKAEIKRRQEPVYKHTLLSQGYERGPVHFFFATPKGLLKPEEVPEYAGWMEVCWNGSGSRLILDVIKAAPRLHKCKFDEKQFKIIRDRMHWRYMNLYFGQ